MLIALFISCLILLIIFQIVLIYVYKKNIIFQYLYLFLFHPEIFYHIQQIKQYKLFIVDYNEYINWLELEFDISGEYYLTIDQNDIHCIWLNGSLIISNKYRLIIDYLHKKYSKLC